MPLSTVTLTEPSLAELISTSKPFWKKKHLNRISRKSSERFNRYITCLEMRYLTTLHWEYYIASMTNGWQRTERWWMTLTEDSRINRGKTCPSATLSRTSPIRTGLAMNLSKCRSVQNKSHTHWPGNEPGPLRWGVNDYDVLLLIIIIIITITIIVNTLIT
jgi:hypothetical protein